MIGRSNDLSRENYLGRDHDLTRQNNLVIENYVTNFKL